MTDETKMLVRQMFRYVVGLFVLAAVPMVTAFADGTAIYTLISKSRGASHAWLVVFGVAMMLHVMLTGVFAKEVISRWIVE